MLKWQNGDDFVHFSKVLEGVKGIKRIISSGTPAISNIVHLARIWHTQIIVPQK